MSEASVDTTPVALTGTREPEIGRLPVLTKAFVSAHRNRIALFAVSFLVTLISFLWFNSLPAVRVGDGMEYYALFYAWSDGLRPWMTPETFQSYQTLVESNTIKDMLPADWLKEAFPALRVRDTADFNHFWFYSMLAAALSRVAGFVGISLDAHSSFNLLHAVLLGGTVAVCGLMHGWRGVLVVVIIMVTSPMMWFVNKVHVEFFSVCVTLCSMALLTRGRYVYAALAMAAAGTQNPGLLIPALVFLCLRFVLERKKAYSLFEVAGIVLTIGLMAIHPFYYLARYDTIATQLTVVGAEAGVALSVFYIWLIDPDLGLFPNWALGFFFLIFGALQWRKRAVDKTAAGLIADHGAVLIGMAVFFLAAIYSHSSTINLNSGGSPGIARYALWYIAPLYPLILMSIHAMAKSRIAAGGLLAATACSAFFTVDRNWPELKENVMAPSMASEWVQTSAPFLYTPPVEVFLERFGGQGEVKGLGAVVGPDCRKVLIVGTNLEAAGGKTFVPGHCDFLALQIQAWTESNRQAGSVFRNLAVASIAPALNLPLGEDILFSSDHAANAAALLSGWSQPEPWGVWSDGPKAVILLPVENPQGGELGLSITLNAFLPPASPRREVGIAVNGQEAVEVVLDAARAQQTVKIPIDSEARHPSGFIRIVFLVKDPISPQDAGLSADGRQLGIGLLSIRVDPESDL